MKNEKKCTKCGEVKSLSEFYKFSKTKDGLQAYCKCCSSNGYVRLTEQEWAIKKGFTISKSTYVKLTEEQWAERKAITLKNRQNAILEKRKAKSDMLFEKAIADFKGEWKYVPENPQYRATSDGRVWSDISNKFLATANHRLGYLFIGKLVFNGKRKLRLLHTVIANTFLDNPEGYTEVNHLDGNKHNNCADNLVFCSRQQNMAHAWELGLMEKVRTNLSGSCKKGESNGACKIKEDQIDVIRSLRKNGMKAKEIANLYNVSTCAIYNLCAGKTWSHIAQKEVA